MGNCNFKADKDKESITGKFMPKTPFIILNNNLLTYCL